MPFGFDSDPHQYCDDCGKRLSYGDLCANVDSPHAGVFCGDCWPITVAVAIEWGARVRHITV